MLKEAVRNAATTVSSRDEPKSPQKSADEKRMAEWLRTKLDAARTEAYGEIVTLVPSLATLLLAANESNRPLSETTLDRIKRDILGGRWEFNGETIVISKDGKLNDGQHRCRAVVDTGQPIRTAIVFGASRESRLTLDQGINRTVAHYLAMNNVTNANAIATISNYIWMYKERGYLATTGRERPTKSEALLVATHYRDIPDSLGFMNRPGVTTLASRPLLAFCHWAIKQKSGEVAVDHFFERLLRGDNLSRGDPILYARQRLLEMKGGHTVSSRAELIFRTWNLHRTKQTAECIALQGNRLPKLEI